MANENERPAMAELALEDVIRDVTAALSSFQAGGSGRG